ncbi:STAS/SEC14 domain-containing protein [Polyangium jinanense]|uniref:STAS/SEC14 domain-containing protein n=1 Tax=Polyangium jinanense TaxID=2829994 RepID=UPI0023410773|nr:STAS/SEC14 domain-containing protein [Polyangium jinanense]MDC3958791.1 STAS/SEC14 domain-containing protein [Polyangium jinanense]
MTVERAPYPPVEMGPHRVQREGPIVHVSIRGNTSLTEMQTLVSVYQATVDEFGYLLILLDMRASGDLTTPARKHVTEFVQAHPTKIASAIYGTTFYLRITLELISRSVRVLAHHTPAMAFHATEAEARRWLAAQVPLLHAKG